MTPALPATTPPLFVRNGLTLDDATFTLARVAQPAAAMTFDGTQTIDGTGTLVFQASLPCASTAAR